MSERSKGDQWADKERADGAWVMKLPASVTAGIPDWLHVKPGQGISLVEAKTLNAVVEAQGVPAQACSGAQRFILSMVEQYGGRARMLILGKVSYAEVSWEQAHIHLSGLQPEWIPYKGDDHE